MSNAPKVLSITVTVQCECEEEHEFETDDLVPFGVMTSLDCDGCDRKICVDGEIFTQYLPTAVTA